MFWDILSGLKGIGIAFASGLIFGALVAGIPVYLHESKKIDLVKLQFKGFVMETERLGLVAKQKAEEQEKADKDAKEKADNEYKIAIASLNADNDKLRKHNASRGFLPAAPASAGSTDRVCFNRAKLDEAIRRFDTGIQAIVGKGDDAMIRLKITKEWANGR